MSGYGFTFQDQSLVARPSGILWWEEAQVLVVSDLHLGKSERLARRGGTLLPPYETRETLTRLDAEIEALRPTTVICLGDSFDDLAAIDGLDEADRLWLTRLMAGRHWIWIEGNHDAGPADIGGSFRAALRMGPLLFRHIPQPGAAGEIAGHYHPKLRLAGRSHRCFAMDEARVILPAFGAYTGGMWADAPPISPLLRPKAKAVLTGRQAIAVPLRGSGG